MNGRQSTSPVLAAISSSIMFLCILSWEGYPGTLHVFVPRAFLCLLFGSVTKPRLQEHDDDFYHWRHDSLLPTMDSEWTRDSQVHSETWSMETTSILSFDFPDSVTGEHSTCVCISDGSFKPTPIIRTSLEVVISRSSRPYIPRHTR